MGMCGIVLGSTVITNNSPIVTNKDPLGYAGLLCLVSSGHNLIDNAAGTYDWTTTDQIGVSPHLKALRNNGGTTLTYALQADSPAIGTGGSTCPITDQRGFVRKHPCDAGAYEMSSTVYAPTVTPDAIENSF